MRDVWRRAVRHRVDLRRAARMEAEQQRCVVDQDEDQLGAAHRAVDIG
jgi:hypothetical protein